MHGLARLVGVVSCFILLLVAQLPAQENKQDAKSSKQNGLNSNICGSSFLISLEGHLLTCAHCVQPATVTNVKGVDTIKVIYQNQEHTARVLFKDKDHDFALLKLDTTVKQSLPICLEEPPQGSEVRAFGYPLAMMLGGGIKVTRGSIAGKVEQDQVRLLQIDAVLNPGNSGGALVNESGSVVGITNAILKPELGQMGFAVPVQEFRSVLDRHKVPYLVQKEQKQLEGTQLVKQVAPAVLPIVSKISIPVARPLRARKSNEPDNQPQKIVRKDFQLNEDGHFDVRSSHGTFPSQRPAFGQIVRDIESTDAMLVGFRVATQQGAFNTIIVGMQPIYLNKGKEVYGKAYGNTIVTTHVLQAREGYAVGGIKCHSGISMDAMQLVFMKVDGDHLDPKDSYLSIIAGAANKVARESTFTDGQFVIGVHGNVNEKDVITSIGLVVKGSK